MPGRKAARRSPTPKYLPHRRRKNNRYGRRPLLFFFPGSLRPHVTNAPPGDRGEERKKDLGVERKSVIYKTEKGRKKPLRKYLFLRFERERDCGGMSESTCLYV